MGFPRSGFVRVRAIVFAFGIVTAAWPQGSAVVTLVTPPGGGNIGLGEAGAARAEDMASMFYNPALLPSLYRRTGGYVNALGFGQDLLPVLDLPDVFQEYRAFGLSLPWEGHHLEWGMGVFRNYVSFGDNAFEDTTGRSRPFRSGETVWALGGGIRFWDCLALGANWKWVDSRLAPPDMVKGDPGSGRARLSTYDLGLHLSRRFPLGSAPVTLEPSLGMAWIDGDDSAGYSSLPDSLGDRHRDPVSRVFRPGWSLELQALEFLSLFAAYDDERDLVARSQRPVRHYGAGITLLSCLEYHRGWLRDPDGKRDELHQSLGMRLDTRALYALAYRLRARDWEPSSPTVPHGPRSYHFLGATWTSGLRLGYTRSWIHGLQEGQSIREGQRSAQVELTL